MFHLEQDDFPVDTHVSTKICTLILPHHGTHISLADQVFEIAKAMGWVPAVADRNKTYLHLNQRIPNELKFDLNCLLYTHGKICRNCIKKGVNQKRKESQDNPCPLWNYCKNLDMT